MDLDSPVISVPLELAADLDRLNDAIAELSAQIEAATARLLGLIRESTLAVAGSAFVSRTADTSTRYP
jgi:hypothetical protein